MTDQELKDLVASLAVAQAKTDAGFEKIQAAQAKTDAQMAKTDAQMAKTDAGFEKIQAAQAKTDAQMAKTDKKLTSMLEMLDGITTSQGLVAEEFFFNTLADSLTVGGVKYDGITSNIRRKINGQWVEVDLILDNGTSLAIIEVKYRARPKNIVQLQNTIRTYRQAFPQYKDFKIYGGIASFNIDDSVADEAHENGFFILKRKGDLLEVDTQGMRAF
jgi:hypothetical protein